MKFWYILLKTPVLCIPKALLWVYNASSRKCFSKLENFGSVDIFGCFFCRRHTLSVSWSLFALLLSRTHHLNRFFRKKESQSIYFYSIFEIKQIFIVNKPFFYLVQEIPKLSIIRNDSPLCNNSHPLYFSAYIFQA